MSLIEQVFAQSEPTFPYDGPFENPVNPPPQNGQAVIKLSAASSAIQVNNTTTADIRIESGEEDIKSYSITITFNSSVLEVVDTNLSQVGVQINFQDTFSNATANTANNSAGTISLSATVSGAAQTINRRIAQITFKAKSSGTSVVSVNKTASSVLNGSNADVLASTTSVNITATGQTQTNNNNNLPQSGLINTAFTIGSALTAVLMLYVGIRTVIDIKKNRSGALRI